MQSDLTKLKKNQMKSRFYNSHKSLPLQGDGNMQVHFMQLSNHYCNLGVSSYFGRYDLLHISNLKVDS